MRVWGGSGGDGGVGWWRETWRCGVVEVEMGCWGGGGGDGGVGWWWWRDGAGIMGKIVLPLSLSAPPARPACQFFYNLFYGIDTTAARLEPLLDQRFTTISPASVPNYRAFPTGETNGMYLVGGTLWGLCA
jgi:hypothetical protein